MLQANDIILKVIALIENPKAWTQGVPARDVEGTSVPPNNQQACKWCMLGALTKVTATYDSWQEAMGKIRDAMQGDVCIATFNDTHTHAEVLALLRKAAA
jgi:hypothetical protein